jgi:hypothetical protein
MSIKTVRGTALFNLKGLYMSFRDFVRGFTMPAGFKKNYVELRKLAKPDDNSVLSADWQNVGRDVQTVLGRNPTRRSGTGTKK